MITHDGYDTRDSYEHAQDAMGENVHNENDDIDSNGRRFQETPSDVVATMRSLIKAQEEQHQLNAAMLQSLTDLQKYLSDRYYDDKIKEFHELRLGQQTWNNMQISFWSY